MGNKFGKFSRGDRLSADVLNKLVGSLPKYDNIITSGIYTDCGNGQVILHTNGNKFGGVGDAEYSAPEIKPFTTRWLNTSKTEKNKGEWQIYLPVGCAILNGAYSYFPKNESGKDKNGDATFQWYKIVDPSDNDANISTIGGYVYKEWTVYVHFKDIPIMYVSTIQDDSEFTGSEDLVVGTILQKEWDDGGGSRRYSRKSTNYMTSNYKRGINDNNGTFQIVFDCEGDKMSEDSYKMKLTNQQINYGVRGIALIKDDTDITEKTDVVLKIDHSQEEVKIEIVDEMSENTIDYTYVRLLKLDEKAIKIDNRNDARKTWPFYGK